MLFSRRHPIRDDELNAYVDGELVAGARSRVEAHLESCAACRETVSSLRSLRGALGALPRAERGRSFVLREADIAPRATRPNGYPLAAQLLSGVTVMAVLAFAALASLDAAGGRSKEATGLTGLASSFQPSAQDSASAPQARNKVTGENTPDSAYREPPSLPATGPLPEATSPNVAQTLPSSTAPAFEGNPSTEATPPTLAVGGEPTAKPPAGPLPAVPGGEQTPSAEITKPLDGNSPTQATPPAEVTKPLDGNSSAQATPPEESTKTLEGLTVETPPTYDRSGQFILPRVVPTTAQKGLGVEAAGGSDTGLRAGEAAAAAVALIAGGSLAFVWWRRRSV